MKIHISTITILLCFVISQAVCQINQELPQISSEQLNASYDNFALEISRNKELQQNKGWKYISRWIDYANRHTAGNGMPPLTKEFTASLKSYEAVKRETTGQRANPWSPAGPFNAPEAITDLIFTGTGRINTIAFHPTDPNIMWIGGGQGGLWKTTNRAASWFPIGDDLPVLRISDIAVNPNNPDEIYICIGDYAYLAYWLETADVKRNTHFGLGVYRSVDGGETWSPTGLTTSQLDKDASLFRRTFIDQSNHDILVAAGIQGVFRSEDRGGSWVKVMDGTVWDIERDYSNPNVLYASTGYIRNLDAGEAAMFKSVDFGRTWQKLEIGIPATGAAQRLEISVSPADSNYIYVVACDLSGGLYGVYRSIDGGSNWELRSDEPNILHWYSGTGNGGQGTYDLAVLADRDDVNRLYVGGINQWVSEDGGLTWNGASYWTGNFGPGVHADHHFLAQSPHDKTIYLCHDGGVSRTEEIIAGSWDTAFLKPDYEWPTVWEHLNEGLANNAFYRLGISRQSDNIFAGAQDMGTFLRDGGTWSYNSLGDGMECIIHPLTDDIIYGSTQYGNVFKSDNRGASFQSLGVNGQPWQGEAAEWTTPYVLHPETTDWVYVPAANLYLSMDGGAVFEKISDLNEYPVSAFAVAPSDRLRMYLGKRVWYGSQQPGEIHVFDSGDWKDISAGTPVDSLYISFLEVDDDDPLIAWATFAGFADGVKVFETRDGGDTWENISLNLPNLPANCIIQHDGVPDNPLYVGMDRGVWYKNDTMDEWELYSEGLPNVIINDFDIHPGEGLLYIATFGRGVWVNNLLDSEVSSTGDLLLESTLNVAPNPSNGPVWVSASDLPIGKYAIELITTTGQVVSHAEVDAPAGTLKAQLDHPRLSGVYYARIRGQAGMRTVGIFFGDN